MQVLGLMTLAFLWVACNAPAPKMDPPTAMEHPKLIKKPGYGNVQSSMQDRSGNLWFGTSNDGIYRFDGKEFHQFTVADGLPSNGINDILEDKDGRIWIGTQRGICLYDGMAFSAVPITVSQDVVLERWDQKQGQIVHDILLDRAGKLWFLTVDGAFFYDGTSFTPFVIDEHAIGFMGANGKAERMFEDRDGNLWFGGRTNTGVYRYDGTSIVNLKVPEIPIRIETARLEKDRTRIHAWAWPQMQDRNGNIWFSNWGGAYRFDGKAFTAFTKSDGLLRHGLVAEIVEDRNGTVWLGGDGLCRYDGTSITCHTEGLIHQGIWTILQDKSGNLWVGTRGTGLYIFDGERFINFAEERR